MDIGNNKKGFTLVEILVVLVIFSIMISAITSVFISGIRTQQNIIAQEQLLDQVNYALDYMGRAIMMAKNGTSNKCSTNNDYYNPKDSPGGVSLKFVNIGGDPSSKDCINFYLLNDQIYKGNSRNENPFTAFTLTSENVKITKLIFNVIGGAANTGSSTNNPQPKVTIYIEAESKSGTPLQKLKIQTTISARDLNESQ
jgi:prepilin-type N-terminal cleavage/methylation domain-containing protein